MGKKKKQHANEMWCNIAFQSPMSDGWDKMNLRPVTVLELQMWILFPITLENSEVHWSYEW